MYKLLPALNSRFVGFEQFFADVEQALANTAKATFPAYNIAKTENGYKIEMAVAGYSKDDIEVVYDNQNNSLSVKGSKIGETASNIYNGIANRNFTKAWNLNPFIEVESCSIKNGILTIVLVETMKNGSVRKIEVTE